MTSAPEKDPYWEASMTYNDVMKILNEDYSTYHKSLVIGAARSSNFFTEKQKRNIRRHPNAIDPILPM
jgi:hypothetical protein